KEQSYQKISINFIIRHFSFASALCAMLCAMCAMLCALCAMPSALCVLNYVRKCLFHFLKVVQPADKDCYNYCERDRHHSEIRSGLAEQCPTEAFDNSRHGVQTIEPSPFVRDKTGRICNRRCVKPELHEEWDDKPDVPVLYIQGSEP